MFYFHSENWGDDPIRRSYFSDGLVNHQLDFLFLKRWTSIVMVVYQRVDIFFWYLEDLLETCLKIPWIDFQWRNRNFDCWRNMYILGVAPPPVTVTTRIITMFSMGCISHLSHPNSCFLFCPEEDLLESSKCYNSDFVPRTCWTYWTETFMMNPHMQYIVDLTLRSFYVCQSDGWADFFEGAQCYGSWVVWSSQSSKFKKWLWNIQL